MSPEMQADLARYQARKERADAEKLFLDPQAEAPSFEDARAQLERAFANLPDKVEIPFYLTPEGERLSKFRTVCDEEFLRPILRDKLPNPKAFDRVANWNGSFPGPLAFGATNTAKSRAAWSAIGRLYVRENKPFAWFPARRLVTELEKYDKHGLSDEFFRQYAHFPTLFIDDLDKINFQFESQLGVLFSFFDWVYRAQRPCVTTTNKTRPWWTEKMGDAFARRLFESAHAAVQF